MIERTEGQNFTEKIIIYIIGIALLTYIFFSMGVITLDKPAPEIPRGMVADSTGRPVPAVNATPTSTVLEITPEPTPEAIPTLVEDYIDPFAPGERSQGQWFKFFRTEVQGLKNLQVGIIVYRSKFLDRYTWYNPSTGNYFSQRPAAGNRYFAVWINQEEMYQGNISDDVSLWAFDEHAFALQVGDQLYTTQNNVTYSPVIRIKEFDDFLTYDKTVTAPAFGYYVRYTGTNPESGGYAAEKLGWLRLGRPIDGFLLYEIPKESKLEDMQLLGEFGNFGSAAWKLDTSHEFHKVITN